jgi:hypothetical protein
MKKRECNVVTKGAADAGPESGSSYAFIRVPVAAMVAARALLAVEKILVEDATTTVLHACHKVLHNSICLALLGRSSF